MRAQEKKYIEKRMDQQYEKRILLVSILVAVLVLGVIAGQFMWSLAVTFFKNGDQIRLCYAGFCKLAQYMEKGLFWGIDAGSFNGATEFFLRSNLPNRYFPILVFAWLAKFVSTSQAYCLFIFLQLFMLCYFSQKTAIRHFNITWKNSCLVMLGSVAIAVYELWYLSFFIVVTLIFPLLYYALNVLKTGKIRDCLLASLFYFLALTSGYMTLSVALFVFIFIFLLVYAWDGWKQGEAVEKKRIVLRLFLPAFIGGLAGVPYCLALLEYNKGVVGNSAASDMMNALYYRASPLNLPQLLFTSYVQTSAVEQEDICKSIGIIWATLLVIVFANGNKIKESAKSKFRLCVVCLGAFSVIYIWSMGPITPIAYWMYSFLPILGSMHLPLRYTMVVLPLLFLMIVSCLEYVPEQNANRIYKVLGVAGIILALAIPIFGTDMLSANFSVPGLVLDLAVAAVFFLFVYAYGIRNGKTVFIICIGVSWYFIAQFYNSNQASEYGISVNNNTIVYNDSDREHLESYIDYNLKNKEIYKFAASDASGGSPLYVPGNYQWFDVSKYNVCNYSGYEPHLCLPEDYRSRVDWQFPYKSKYMVDTRADFLVVDNVMVEENQEFFDTIVDWEKSGWYLNGGAKRICALKHFIPSCLTGESYVLDTEDSMDNGYFYSHELTDEQLLEFDTDDATYFKAVIDADQEADVVFLLYPNRHYRYYVDKKEVAPNEAEMQTWIRLNAGTHAIEIVYDNKFDRFTSVVMIAFVAMIAIGVIGSIIFEKTHKAAVQQNTEG